MAADTRILSREHTFTSLRKVVQMTRLLNEYRVTVDPDTLVIALALMADEFAGQRCQVENCEVCSSFVDEWHELRDSLDEGRKSDLARSMRGRAIPVPTDDHAGF